MLRSVCSTLFSTSPATSLSSSSLLLPLCSSSPLLQQCAFSTARKRNQRHRRIKQIRQQFKVHNYEIFKRRCIEEPTMDRGLVTMRPASEAAKLFQERNRAEVLQQKLPQVNDRS